MLLEITEGHSMGADCPRCGNDRAGTSCVHARYSRHYLRFVNAHREAFDAAYLDGNPQAARPEMERLQREWDTMLSRHYCTCRPDHCSECMKLSVRLNRLASGVCGTCLPLPAQQRDPRCVQCARLDPHNAVVEIGRSSPVQAPMPGPVVLLDLNAGYAA